MPGAGRPSCEPFPSPEVFRRPKGIGTAPRRGRRRTLPGAFEGGAPAVASGFGLPCPSSAGGFFPWSGGTCSCRSPAGYPDHFGRAGRGVLGWQLFRLCGQPLAQKPSTSRLGTAIPQGVGEQHHPGSRDDERSKHLCGVKLGAAPQGALEGEPFACGSFLYWRRRQAFLKM